MDRSSATRDLGDEQESFMNEFNIAEPLRHTLQSTHGEGEGGTESGGVTASYWDLLLKERSEMVDAVGATESELGRGISFTSLFHVAQSSLLSSIVPFTFVFL